MHLITGQAYAVIHQVAALDSAQGRIGIQDIGRPLFDRRVRKQPQELIHRSRDYAHDGVSLAQLSREMDTSRTSRTNNRDLCHDGTSGWSETFIPERLQLDECICSPKCERVTAKKVGSIQAIDKEPPCFLLSLGATMARSSGQAGWLPILS